MFSTFARSGHGPAAGLPTHGPSRAAGRPRAVRLASSLIVAANPRARRRNQCGTDGMHQLAFRPRVPNKHDDAVLDGDWGSFRWSMERGPVCLSERGPGGHGSIAQRSWPRPRHLHREMHAVNYSGARRRRVAATAAGIGHAHITPEARGADRSRPRRKCSAPGI